MFENLYHYSVGNKKTFYKVEAIMWANENNEQVNFNVPTWMENLPIHVEPEESLQELCRRSALRIRQQYEYVRLWFSGGIDSTYMLEAFIDNKIHIDEIITVGSGIPESDWEIDKVATPYLKKLHSKIPNTKITVKKATMAEYKDWYSNDYFFENHKSIGKNEGYWSMRLGRKHQSIHLLDSPRGTVNVVAMDKPNIIFKNGEWYAFYMDTKYDNQLGDGNQSFHLFYDDDPLIFTKQCQLLKKAIMNYTSDENEWNKFCFSQDEKYQIIRNGCVRNNDGKFRKFILKTPIGIGEKEFEAESYKESRALKFMATNYPEFYKKYLNGVDYLNSIGDGKWFNKGNAKLADVGIFAPFKSLDTNSTKTVDELFPNGFKI